MATSECACWGFRFAARHRSRGAFLWNGEPSDGAAFVMVNRHAVVSGRTLDAADPLRLNGCAGAARPTDLQRAVALHAALADGWRMLTTSLLIFHIP